MNLVMLVALLVMHAQDAAEKPRPAFVATAQYATQEIEGWTVHVNRSLSSDRKELGDRALRLLRVKLFEITRVVPAEAAAKLRQVPIWLGVDDGHAPCAEYHPSREWLQDNGYNPDKAQCVEIGNAQRFLDWSLQQPWMVLHELAHAYLDRCLGEERKTLRDSYQAAVDGGRYDAVLRWSGERQRAYALENDQEYFAEGCEAFFGTNDFYPFVRAELRQQDPDLCAFIARVWGVAR